MTTLTESPTYKIPEANMPRLEKLLEKLAKRAKRLGQLPISLEVVDTVREVKSDGVTVKKFFICQVHGERPGLNGWHFVSKIAHEETGNVLFTIPGETVPEQYRLANSECEHCHQSRNRSFTYLVANEAGNVKQVGSTCLGDFTGWASPAVLAAMAECWFDAGELLSDAEEDDFFDGDGNMKVQASFDLLGVLSLAAASIRKDGYCSRSNANPPAKFATADIVETMLGRPGMTQPEDVELAQKVLDWARNEWLTGDAGSNEYVWNMGVILWKDEIKAREFGWAVSVFGQYRKAQEKVLSGAVGFIGEVDDVVEFIGKVISVRMIDTQFGWSQLVKIITDKGQAVSWFAGLVHDVEEGATYAFSKAKVKEQVRFNGSDETRIGGRVKIVDLTEVETQGVLL